MSNRYTPDNNFIIDANGRQYAVETPHPLPLPSGVGQHVENGCWLLRFGGGELPTDYAAEAGRQWWDTQRVWHTHWIIRKPLPTVPKPKTQEEKDADAMLVAWDKWGGGTTGTPSFYSSPMSGCFETAWKSALRYARQ